MSVNIPSGTEMFCNENGEKAAVVKNFYKTFLSQRVSDLLTVWQIEEVILDRAYELCLLG